ncbi:hypothetical protein [Streptomyces sp. BE230]|uniref:hypothetical protein n=1 Tax=Streptomyces sp. BE230 TaxID=3002526 RepID=UPI002ED4E15C|nr:hypothetical protein [Streptomyces sp. BE230]
MPFDQYRTVVAALDRLTTQVGRVADAMPTPVVEEDDTPQTTDDDGPMTPDDWQRFVDQHAKPRMIDTAPTAKPDRTTSRIMISLAAVSWCFLGLAILSLIVGNPTAATGIAWTSYLTIITTPLAFYARRLGL